MEEARAARLRQDRDNRRHMYVTLASFPRHTQHPKFLFNTTFLFPELSHHSIIPHLTKLQCGCRYEEQNYLTLRSRVPHPQATPHRPTSQAASDSAASPHMSSILPIATNTPSKHLKPNTLKRSPTLGSTDSTPTARRSSRHSPKDSQNRQELSGIKAHSRMNSLDKGSSPVREQREAHLSRVIISIL